jgi:hypothetical protein
VPLIFGSPGSPRPSRTHARCSNPTLKALRPFPQVNPMITLVVCSSSAEARSAAECERTELTYSGQTIGMTTIAVTTVVRVSGSPSLGKSENRYPPIP